MFWKMMKWLGTPVALVIIGGFVLKEQVDRHLEDGHPNTVKEMVHEQEVRAERIETKLDDLIKTVERFEKKIENTSVTGVNF